MHFRHHRQGETIATTMSLTTGLLPPLFWAVHLGRGRPVWTRCFLALGALEPLSEIADRGLQRCHFSLQGPSSGRWSGWYFHADCPKIGGGVSWGNVGCTRVCWRTPLCGSVSSGSSSPSPLA